MQVEQYDGVIGADVSRRVMAIRLVTGLLQGLVLYWLYRSGTQGVWPATTPYLFIPLVLLVLLLPPLLISSLGHMAPRRVALWCALAALVLLVFGLHDIWRTGGSEFNAELLGRRNRHQPSTMAMMLAAAFLYISHALVMAGTLDGKRIASYGSYFEVAWKLAVQLLFSAFFVSTLWAVLWMGAGLFGLVKLDFLSRLLEKPWFFMPVIFFALSWALHITDVRPAIVRGIRTLLLVLASWLLPVAVLVIAGFLCTLPFTGLEALWGTRRATSVLLGASAMLIMLINAAFQNGQTAAPLAIRVSARMGAILLLPLAGIAVYALGLRVHDYGWTSDRIIAAACLLVVACYAIGYQWAAHRYHTWLVEIAPVNVAAAFLVLAVLLALFTPLADPARLSVNNQMARLQSGAVTADRFDYLYLRFDGQRYGQQALEQLAAQGVGDNPKLVSERAAAALKRTRRWDPKDDVLSASSLADNLTLWPSTARLPDSFLSQPWNDVAHPELPACMRGAGPKCDVVMIDPDSDGKQDVLVLNKGYLGGYLFSQSASGRWQLAAYMRASACKPLLEALREGRYTLAPPRYKALDIGGVQLLFDPVFNPDDCKNSD